MNWKVLGAGAVIVLPLIWLLQQGFGRDPHALPSALEGKVAPGFSLNTLEGEAVSLSDFSGKPVVLNFWASWCRPCLQEHPVLLEAARRYQRRGVVFLGVSYGDEPRDAQAFLDQHGQAYPTLADPDQRTAIDYGVAGVPETFFVAPDGTVALKISGPVSEEIVVKTIEGML